jgi:hypothetical protein
MKRFSMLLALSLVAPHYPYQGPADGPTRGPERKIGKSGSGDVKKTYAAMQQQLQQEIDAWRKSWADVPQHS